MVVAQYFVEFIFYSFLGWVWESIYCTIKNKAWQDRGFLFGPVCPIYGSCVVAADIVFTKIKFFSTGNTPIWQIFLICMVGSAIAEYLTSLVLEIRFHARWWDYSRMPLNIQGRICLPVSIGFGLAGIVVVKYLIPRMNGMHGNFSPISYEILMLIFALMFGADYALTQASLSSLLTAVEEYKAEMNRRAEATYTSISTAPQRIEESMAQARESLAERAGQAKESLAEGVVEAKESLAERAGQAKESLGGGMAQARENLTEGVVEAKESLAERAGQAKESFAERAEQARENFAERASHYVGKMSFNQKRILGNIEKFSLREDEKQRYEVSPAQHLKNALRINRRNKKAQNQNNKKTQAQG